MTKEKIKQLRLDLGLNQHEMAKVYGFGSYQRISEIENGGVISPGISSHAGMMIWMNERIPKKVDNYIKYILREGK